MADLIKPKPFSTTDMDGVAVNVLLSRFPAVDGQKILCKYPTGMIPKISDYDKDFEPAMLMLMSYVAIDNGTETPQRLLTQALIDNHIPDAETSMKIQMAMMEYNCSFFRKGRISDFFDEFVQMIFTKISEMSTRSSEQLSAKEKPLSTSSGQSTT